MDIRPILSTLRRHKTAAALIVLEIALSCAIICNAVFLISGRIDNMRTPSGIAEDELVRVQVSGMAASDNAHVVTREDLAALRAIPGVKAATLANQIPFGNSGWNSSITLEREQARPTLSAAVYMAEEQMLRTFGLRLVAGRWFNSDEYVDYAEFDNPGPTPPRVPAMLVTREAAERLFPGENAVGKQVYAWGEEQPVRIVGIVERLARPSKWGGPAQAGYSMILPVRPSYQEGGNYLLRTDPARRDEVLKAALAYFEHARPTRIVALEDSKPFTEVRGEYFRQDESMVWLLSAVCVALLVVTALGIVGLASFWVQQRTKQIGIRRALGATRGQILRYFQMENFLLATLGIVLGMLLAYGINQMLMGRYELPRLPALYLPIGAVALWLLGQFAVYGPARRAAAVPPAVATRSV
ncbi:ABC transporter permease [Vulcaniibacterium tengchongense]|uniref:Putative ABC transport system permease protein n=1 Tax=Vulcaniibacterium tengchongense TaxID=1273429 RepID=A0A3N4V074_9GAMM|nr:FtsX-like permease family protein [Vulcaniibacterium tengchongense]RPE75828.1 putative ABC transport system permease protein [Vulcaniibacterium tengchongense]